MELHPRPASGRVIAELPRCPFCHEGVEQGAARSCQHCAAPVHGECWSEMGVCPACLRPPPGQLGVKPRGGPRAYYSGVPTVELECVRCAVPFRVATRLAQYRTRCDACLVRHNRLVGAAVLLLAIALPILRLLKELNSFSPFA